MYKLLFLDLDGTLLNEFGEISEENKIQISKAQSLGTEVILASGRPTISTLNLSKKINSNKFLISGNGAVIYDIQNNKKIFENYLSKEKVLEIINVCEQNSIYYSIYTDDMIIAKSLNYNVLYYYHENRNKEEHEKIPINLVENIYEYIKRYEKNDFLKIMITDDIKSIFNGIIQKLERIKDINILDVEHMSRKRIISENDIFNIEYYYSEISNQETNKWNAIRYISQILGIESEEIMAIGDNVNDKEMIENVGNGIIMENAPAYLKHIAKDETFSNRNEGVAEAIKRYITYILQQN